MRDKQITIPIDETLGPKERRCVTMSKSHNTFPTCLTIYTSTIGLLVSPISYTRQDLCVEIFNDTDVTRRVTGRIIMAREPQKENR